MKLLDPLGIAWNRMVNQLFRPFEIGSWFLLGFSAFLASFLTGGTNISSWGGNGKDTTLPSWEPEVWILLISALVLVVLAVFLILIWLGCRGQFMLLDNVIKGTAEVRLPWREFRERANSLFRLYLLAFAIWILLMLVFGGLAFAYFWFAPRAIDSWVYYLPFALCIGLFFVFAVVLSITVFFARDFGLLWMYRHGGTAWEATLKIWDLAKQYPADFLLYLIMRFLLAIVLLFIALLVGCLTCCIGFLPYLSSVITLPLSVFRVWYTIECFAQLGPDCDVRLPPSVPPSIPPSSGY